MMNDAGTKSVKAQAELHGPLLDVPVWAFDRSMPDHWFDDVVNLCMEWSTRTIHSLPLQNQNIEESKLLAVGLAMRDVDLIAHTGRDIRSAWSAIPWPEGIKLVRREVCWVLSERARMECNSQTGVSDLFDVYEPTRAAYKACMAERSAQRNRLEGFENEACMLDAFASLQHEIASDRKKHDDADRLSSVAFFTGAFQ